MNRKHMAAALLALTLLLSGCGRTEEEGQTLRLFYPVTAYEAGGDVLQSEAIDWSAQVNTSATEQVEEVIRILQNRNGEMDFTSPIPQGVELLQCTVSNGLAVLNFSTAYQWLSGMKMTIADYCITLSAAQIPGVRRVQIIVDGQPISGKENQTFTTGDVLMTSSEDIVKAVTVTLYFPDAEGALREEKRELLIYEGENRCRRVLDALLEGPQTEGLLPLLPEDAGIAGVWQDESTCCLNFSSNYFRKLCNSSLDQDMIVQGLVRSVCSLEGVQSLQILVDGTYRTMLGQVNIKLPLTP